MTILIVQKATARRIAGQGDPRRCTWLSIRAHLTGHETLGLELEPQIGADAVAHHQHRDGVLLVVLRGMDGVGHLVRRTDRLSADPLDDVAGLNTALVGVAARRHLSHHNARRARRQVQLVAHVRRQRRE